MLRKTGVLFSFLFLSTLALESVAFDGKWAIDFDITASLTKEESFLNKGLKTFRFIHIANGKFSVTSDGKVFNCLIKPTQGNKGQVFCDGRDNGMQAEYDDAYLSLETDYFTWVYNKINE